MLNSTGRFVLGMEIVTPTGMNLDIASQVAKADLSRFDQFVANDGVQRFQYAKIEYSQEQELFDKTCELTTYILDSLLAQLPRSLKPIPLLISIPISVSRIKMQEWLNDSDYADYISWVDVIHSSGPNVILKALQSLDKFDAMLCVSVDSLVSSLEDLIANGSVMSTHNPWGIIPSEGAAGVILCRRNTVETLKLTPKAQVGYVDSELDMQGKRGMFRLVQRASKVLTSFGDVYSDMTSLRAHTEDYGFVLGAKAQRFHNPESPYLINQLWGTMGSCSSLVLLAYAIYNHHFNQPASLLMCDLNGDKALIQLLAL